MLYFLIFAALCFIISCAVKPKKEPITKTITIFYTSDLNLNNIGRITTLIKRERMRNPGLFIINGKIFSEDPISTLYRGEAEITILNSAGIDAIVLTPDFLRFGFKRAQELINQGDFFFLGANLYQTDKLRALAHEYFIKDLAKTKVSILGMLSENTDFYKKLTGIEQKDPIHTAKRIVPLLRMRSDLVGLTLTKPDSIALPDIDFVIGTINTKSIWAPACKENEALRWLYLYLSDNNIIVDYNKSVVPVGDSIEEDSLVKATRQTYLLKTDSMLDVKLSEVKKEIDIKSLTSILNQAILNETKADGIIAQNQIVKKSIAKGSLTCRDLLEALSFSGNLPIIELSGKEIEALKTKKLNVVWSSRMKNPKLLDTKIYRIVITPDLIETNPEWQDKEITLSDTNIITLMVNYFKKGRK